MTNYERTGNLSLLISLYTTKSFEVLPRREDIGNMWSICQYENREFGESSFSGRTSFERSSLNDFLREQLTFFRLDG